jgi:hypothetical protein
MKGVVGTPAIMQRRRKNEEYHQKANADQSKG